MAITLEQITQLREKTGVSLQSCKKAMTEAGGDLTKAIEILRKKGEAKAVERGERQTGQGAVEAYIHSNRKIGVLVQLGCETDFVARNEEFIALARDLAMHITASNPLYVSPDDVPHELIEKEAEIWRSELAKEGKPEKIWDNILKGKEKKFREQISLLAQPFVKNPDLTVEQLLKEIVTKMGENIRVIKFARMSF